MGTKLSTDERRKLRVRRQLKKWRTGDPPLGLPVVKAYLRADYRRYGWAHSGAASTKDKDYGGEKGGNVEAAGLIGKQIAERAIKAGVENVVFDRGGYIYHGRVKALAEAAREAGLKF